MKALALFCILLALTPGGRPEPRPQLPIETVSYAAEFSDDRILVGAAHNVFAGKVLKRIRTVRHTGLPHSRFEVAVILNVKGDLRETVFLDQLGAEQKGLIRRRTPAADDTPPLQEGSTYVFATRSPALNPEQIFRLNSHSNATTLLTKDATLSTEKLKSLVDSHPRIHALREAYKNEIIPEVYQKDARNRFQPPPRPSEVK
jgi:hypothetical protein